MHSTKTFNNHLKTLGKSKFGFERTVVSKFKSKRRVGSENELVDYSRAPCLGADQWARGLWDRVNKLTSVFYASVLLLIMNFVITLSN